MIIPYNKPYMTGKEITYIQEAYEAGRLSGDGYFTKACHTLLEKKTQSKKVLLTHSCTAALEMCALLLDIKAGDEIIMPSFTFVSSANAFVLRGAIPVFVDIRGDTQNIDEQKIEEAITKKTKAICVVHYAGVACEMDIILAIAKKHNLQVIEDAAQGICASYKGKLLGSIADFGTYSFHETKNITSGEGGALIINNQEYVELAEIIREKGTDRSRFFRKEVDKYTWQEKGSSFLPGELVAAFLYAQLQEMENIIKKRLEIWDNYHYAFEELEKKGKIQRPYIPEHCKHNAHIYYLLLHEKNRELIVKQMAERGISAIMHYVPLHSSPAGLKYGRVSGGLVHTQKAGAALLRLPLFYSLSQQEQNYIIENLIDIL